MNNKPVNFEIISQLDEEFLTIAEIKAGINEFLSSDFTELDIPIRNELEFQEVYKDYTYLEAAGGIVQYNKEFLFIKRNDIWDIPKGKLEKNESPEEGALREIEEECNVKGLTIHKHLIDTYHTYEMNGKNYLKKTFWYWVKMSKFEELNLKPQTEEGISLVKLFPKTEFKRIKANTYLSIIDVIKALEKVV